MSIFKAYDIRGVYPSELNEESAYRIGRAFVKFLKVKEVVVGRDMRLSSDSLFEALSRGITDEGANVIDIGMVTTPMLYFGIANYGHESGIMITASHNPKQFNGFKLCRENAIPMSGETGIKDIQRLVEENEFGGIKSKGGIAKKDIYADYEKQILGFLPGIIKNEDPDTKIVKVVIDCSNGASGPIMKQVFAKIPCEYHILYEKPDGNFPNHEANPLKEENLRDLKAAVRRYGADFGVCLDGDADRSGFIDEKGNMIPGDKVTAIIAKGMLEQQKVLTILYDLRSSRAVKEEIEADGGKAVMCRVGHSFIKNQMRKDSASFAGELSGHFYFRDNFFTESEFLPIFNIMKLAAEGKKISQVVAPLGRYFQSGEINFEVKNKDIKLKELEKKYRDEAENVFYLDGISMEFKGWRFNVRASNTENILRLNLEADTKALMEEKRNEIEKLLKS